MKYLFWLVVLMSPGVAVAAPLTLKCTFPQSTSDAYFFVTIDVKKKTVVDREKEAYDVVVT